MSSRGSTFAAFGTAVALLTLTACSSATTGTASGPAGAVPAAVATSSPDAGAPPGAEILGRPGVGEPFTLTIGYTDTPKLDEFEVTVDEVRCGEPLDPKVLAHAADSVTVPSPTPTPEDGKQFCVVTMEVLNTGKGEAYWSADGAATLNVDDTAYSPTQSDNDLAKAYEEYRSDQGEADPSSGINPGSKGPEHGIFQIPAGDKPTTLWVASAHLLETINGVEPGYLVQLTPTD
ncbi:DUF4352 domain-containing protein [Streptomyces microflavus]|uniref:DUF4352 domain-containing protein n=1 Tax=Streptomyces microflavus TaxID=1919 RepID=A0A7J0CSU9_STRMI|nr:MULTISPECIES: DUF4352 domain-containing protein [Streptomyces]MDX2979520.1 DUF4352 domain-containing protein [Streptomyces sp. NRRL_B-2249]GFN05369.1 hypothetical protein Smic_39250 [Streptomyces microflavus]GGX52306.1 hypothetical protein GCM10010298_15110 [Streptomyces microflavus]